jgi:GNAT superfamily N-acetyltransferase
MSDPAFIIRSMTREEINTAIDWASDEGWNPGIFDADAFHAADEEGFLIGMLGDEKVAMISAIRYGKNFGHIGFFVVKPEHRGGGYGSQIWQAAMDRLAGRVMGLDGVVSQQDFYKHAGFELAQRNIGYRCSGGGPMPPMALCEKIVSMPFLSLDDILAYDLAFFPEERRAFFQKWISIPYSTVMGIRENGKLTAFCVMRPCREGFKIAPLFADTPKLAETLFMVMRAQTREHENIFIDMPESNPAAMALAKRYDMEIVFETGRMYFGSAPDLSIPRTYGITSPELG